ncbi:MAG: rRNA adenine N-6-methyltransferase family protein [Planctomycetota bacterium]
MTEGKAPRGGPVQTRAYLMEMLEATGLSPRRQLGQNFLIDLNLLQLLVETANPRKSDVVLEVGAGTGGLTSRLAERAGQVISVELDPGFYHLACRETKGFNNVTLIAGDALAHKNQMNPEVLDALRQAMAKVGTDHYHLAANLPYDVAALVIANPFLKISRFVP